MGDAIGRDMRACLFSVLAVVGGFCVIFHDHTLHLCWLNHQVPSIRCMYTHHRSLLLV